VVSQALAMCDNHVIKIRAHAVLLLTQQLLGPRYFSACAQTVSICVFTTHLSLLLNRIPQHLSIQNAQRPSTST